MSVFAAACREMMEGYHLAAQRQVSPTMKKHFEEMRDHFHDKAIEWEARFYPTNTEETPT